jgi:hypothetical protein
MCLLHCEGCRTLITLNILRLHVLLLLLMQCLLQEVSTFNGVQRKLRGELGLLLLISRLLRAVLPASNPLQPFVIPADSQSLSKLTFFFVVINGLSRA